MADALYMLLGVTPANGGSEVRCLLQKWRDKDLTLGSSICEEIQYMSVNVWGHSGLGDMGSSLTTLLEDGRLKKVHYVRNPADTPLSTFLNKSRSSGDAPDLYRFNEGIPQILLNSTEVSEQSNRAQTSGTQSATAKSMNVKNGDSPQKAPVQGHDNAFGGAGSIGECDEFFSAAAKDEVNSFGQTSLPRHMRPSARAAPIRVRTISARDLVQIDTSSGGGYAVLKIVPGLHPVLRSPGDSCTIPVLQQKSLGRNHDSLEKSPGFAHSKIEAIFSHNGATWEHLNQLPPGSTLMGNGFYLRKSCEGTWVLLLGASTPESLENPPYLLWSLLDTVRLGALDFDERVSSKVCGKRDRLIYYVPQADKDRLHSQT